MPVSEPVALADKDVILEMPEPVLVLVMTDEVRPVPVPGEVILEVLVARIDALDGMLFGPVETEYVFDLLVVCNLLEVPAAVLEARLDAEFEWLVPLDKVAAPDEICLTFEETLPLRLDPASLDLMDADTD